MAQSVTVAGVDVGGPKKGFHAVALRDGAYLDKFSAHEASAIAAWCLGVGARLVGVDAPCRWSQTGRARPAERELMKGKIWCFSTPTRERAVAHPKKHFHWMLAGEALYEALQETYPILAGNSESTGGTTCFETFPQAIACALAGKVVLAKDKAATRRALLQQAGLSIEALTNIDTVDAALCALAAHYLASGSFKAYGEPESGLIVVPAVKEKCIHGGT